MVSAHEHENGDELDIDIVSDEVVVEKPKKPIVIVEDNGKVGGAWPPSMYTSKTDCARKLHFKETGEKLNMKKYKVQHKTNPDLNRTQADDQPYRQTELFKRAIKIFNDQQEVERKTKAKYAVDFPKAAKYHNDEIQKQRALKKAAGGKGSKKRKAEEDLEHSAKRVFEKLSVMPEQFSAVFYEQEREVRNVDEAHQARVLESTQQASREKAAIFENKLNSIRGLFVARVAE